MNRQEDLPRAPGKRYAPFAYPRQEADVAAMRRSFRAKLLALGGKERDPCGECSAGSRVQ
jgi:hypothetical protein